MRKYVIFSVSELNKIDFDDVLETSENTIRKSIDGLKTFVKFEGQEPNFINNLTTKEGPYNYDEFVDILNTNEWNKSNPI